MMMVRLQCFARRWSLRQEGTASVEYAVLLALVVAVLAATLIKLTAALDGKLQALIHSLGLGS